MKPSGNSTSEPSGRATARSRVAKRILKESAGIEAQCASSNVVSRSPRRCERCGRGAYVVSRPERCDTRRMRTLLLGPSLPYIMDLETGISFPRNRSSQGRIADRVSHEEIRRQAYSLWEAEGHPDNRGLAHWLSAETQLQSASPSRVKALSHESRPSTPSTVTASAPATRPMAHDGPSPLCREAAGDDVRDYAFYLYVQSGCDPARKVECWTEANSCLGARIPKSASGTDTGSGGLHWASPVPSSALLRRRTTRLRR